MALENGNHTSVPALSSAALPTTSSPPPQSQPDSIQPPRYRGPPRCVILGAGYAGALLARELEPHVKARKMALTVVERRDGVHLKIGAIRASVRGGEWIDRVRVPLNRVVRNSKTVVGNVVRVSPIEQLLYFDSDSHQDPVPYDILICATGAHNDSPGDLPASANTKDTVRAFLRGVCSAIRDAKDIVVVGGGASAVEYAGEIRDAYPDKPITIVSSAQHLLSTSVAPLKPKFFSKLYATLEKHNIKIIRGEKVIYPTTTDFDPKLKFIKGPVDVRTEGAAGLTLRADLVIWAASWKVNTSIYPQSWLNDYGELFVSDTFQLLDDAKVFAIGDVSSTIEYVVVGVTNHPSQLTHTQPIHRTKQAITLPPKITFLVKNIVRVCNALQKGLEPESIILARYRTRDMAVMHLPITSRDGISQWLGFVFGGNTTSRWKGKDLYTDKFWLHLTGHKAPLAMLKNDE